MVGTQPGPARPAHPPSIGDAGGAGYRAHLWRASTSTRHLVGLTELVLKSRPRPRCEHNERAFEAQEPCPRGFRRRCFSEACAAGRALLPGLLWDVDVRPKFFAGGQRDGQSTVLAAR